MYLFGYSLEFQVDGSQEQLMMLHVRARSYGSSPGSFLGWFSSFSMMKRMMLMIGPILLIILFIDGCGKKCWNSWFYIIKAFKRFCMAGPRWQKSKWNQQQ